MLPGMPFTCAFLTNILWTPLASMSCGSMAGVERRRRKFANMLGRRVAMFVSEVLRLSGGSWLGWLMIRCLFFIDGWGMLRHRSPIKSQMEICWLQKKVVRSDIKKTKKFNCIHGIEKKRVPKDCWDSEQLTLWVEIKYLLSRYQLWVGT